MTKRPDTDDWRQEAEAPAQLRRCMTCGEIAVWFYASEAKGYCDVCVPRGCSCVCHREEDYECRPEPCVDFALFEEGWPVDE